MPAIHRTAHATSAERAATTAAREGRFADARAWWAEHARALVATGQDGFEALSLASLSDADLPRRIGRPTR